MKLTPEHIISWRLHREIQRKERSLLRNWIILFYICIGKTGVFSLICRYEMNVIIWRATVMSKDRVRNQILFVRFLYSWQALWRYWVVCRRRQRVSLKSLEPARPTVYTNTLFHFPFNSTRLLRFLLQKGESKLEYFKLGSIANIDLSFNAWFMLQVTGLLRVAFKDRASYI
jgi:hypothetical protein